MAATPRLSLELVPQNSQQPDVPNGLAMYELDALVQPAAQTVGSNTPPGSPTTGACYVVGTSPTGAWASKAKNLAQWDSSAWRFYAPLEGMSVYNAGDASLYRYNAAGSWERAGSRMLEGSATYDPPSLADGAGTTTTVTVTGAALGDFALASFSLTLSGITMTAFVSAADTVSVRLQNESGGPLDLASGTLRARVLKA